MKRFLIFTCLVVALAWSVAPVYAQAGHKGMCQLLSPAEENWQQCYQRVTRSLVADKVPDSATQQYRQALYDTLLTCIGEDLTDGSVFTFRGKGWATFTTEETHGISWYFQWDETHKVFLRTVVPGELYAFFFIGHPDVTILLKRTDSDVAIPNLTTFDTAQAVAYGMTRATGKNANQARIGWQQLRMRKTTEVLRSSVADSVLQDWQRHYDLTPTVADPLSWHQDAILSLESSLFEDVGGLERCTVMVGNWLAFRFPGSQLVHFIYVPAAAKLAKK